MSTNETRRRRRSPTPYSDADRKRLIEEHAGSGLSKVAFCRERGINLGTFYTWTKRSVRQEKRSRFAEVELPRARPEGVIEIVLGNGTVVRVPPGPDVVRSALLIRVIAGCRAETP